jgi:UDP-N-acetylglucosamine:LPS N-acetylglucosamine transferase
LILTTHTGGGHLNLAQSLKEMLETRYEVVIEDPQDALVDLWYASASRHFLNFLEWQFVFTDNEIFSLWLHKSQIPLGRKRIANLIERVRPRLIVTTHALLSYVTARAIERLPRRVPLVFQLTDLGRLHMTWFSEKLADAYLAPTREIFAQAEAQRIDRNRLYLTGRPVRRQFNEISPQVRKETLVALNFNPAMFTVFLQGGAKGSAGVDRTIENLLSSGVPTQIILATGNNKSMAARYAGIEQIRTLPFTESIAPFMAAADMIAGKAGASSITEAFILEKPFLATAYIPGQETANLEFIERHNLGWVCLETTAQKELISRIASNPARIAEKLESIRDYKAWNMQANQDICPIFDRLLSSEVIGDQESK